MVDRERAARIDAKVGLRLGDESFVVTIAKGGVTAARGAVEGTDAILTAAPSVIAAAVYGGVPLAALEAEGVLTIDGDRDLAETFVTLFVLPPKLEH